jgi:tetratricopeptide (TPR) repeat protein
MRTSFVDIFIYVFFASYFLLTSYFERRFKKLETLDSTRRLKYVTYTSFYLILAFLAVTAARLILVTREIAIKEQFLSTRFAKLSYISLAALVIFGVWMAKVEMTRYKWFRKSRPPYILASSFIQKCEGLVKAHNFDQAKDYLVKACELVPDDVELWCRLGLFNELFTQNQQESDRCMDKAKAILDSAKEPNYKEIACYESYLGDILCNRGQPDEGFKHLEKSVELDPNPIRLKGYKKKLAELKQQDQPAQD